MVKFAVSSLLTVLACGIAGVAANIAHAQPWLIGTAAVPEKLPYDIPYGPPLTLAQARKIIDAAEAEARRRHGQYAIAEAKARASAEFRRPTKAMQDAVSNGATAVLSIPGILAGEGGLPIVIDGKLVGAVGASGAARVQDSVIAEAGAAAVSTSTPAPASTK